MTISSIIQVSKSIQEFTESSDDLKSQLREAEARLRAANKKWDDLDDSFADLWGGKDDEELDRQLDEIYDNEIEPAKQEVEMLKELIYPPRKPKPIKVSPQDKKLVALVKDYLSGENSNEFELYGRTVRGTTYNQLADAIRRNLKMKVSTPVTLMHRLRNMGLMVAGGEGKREGRGRTIRFWYIKDK